MDYTIHDDIAEIDLLYYKVNYELWFERYNNASTENYVRGLIRFPSTGKIYGLFSSKSDISQNYYLQEYIGL